MCERDRVEFGRLRPFSSPFPISLSLPFPQIGELDSPHLIVCEWWRLEGGGGGEEKEEREKGEEGGGSLQWALRTDDDDMRRNVRQDTGQTCFPKGPKVALGGNSCGSFAG